MEAIETESPISSTIQPGIRILAHAIVESNDLRMGKTETGFATNIKHYLNQTEFLQNGNK